jgi:hypothetical protein
LPLSIGKIWTQRSIRTAETADECRLLNGRRWADRLLAMTLTAFSTLINLVALVLPIRAIMSGYAGTAVRFS